MGHVITNIISILVDLSRKAGVLNLFAASILMATMSANAQSNFLDPGDDPASPVHWETWSGGEMTANAWFTYGGISYAFNGALAPGWRLRGATGYGEYTYGHLEK